MAPTVWLITGASRGLGLGFVQQLLEDPAAHVVAAARAPESASGLQELSKSKQGSRLTLVALEVDREESVKAAAAEVKKKFGHLDYLVNNAGLHGTNGPDFAVQRPNEPAEPLESIERTIRTNVIGPIITARAFYPLLQNGSKKTVVTISSSSASISEHQASAQSKDKPPIWHTGGLSYDISKAAVNMETAVLGAQLKDEGFIFLALHPGWVDTDMGNMGGDVYGLEKHFGEPAISIRESITGCLKVIRNLSPADNARYISYQGKDYPL